MGLIEDIMNKCLEVQKATEFNKALARKAKDPAWLEVDPDYAMLKTMSRLSADKVIVLASELRALIP